MAAVAIQALEYSDKGNIKLQIEGGKGDQWIEVENIALIKYPLTHLTWKMMGTFITTLETIVYLWELLVNLKEDTAQVCINTINHDERNIS